MSLVSWVLFFAQAIDLLGDVHRGLALHVAELFDLRFELGDRLFKFKEVSLAHGEGPS